MKGGDNMPYRIGTRQQTPQGKTAVNIEGPGIQAPGLRLSFASPNDGEAFVIGLNFAFAHGFRAALGLPGCTQCDRLWDKYVKASEEHIRLIEQKLSNRVEPEVREALESRIEAASFLRLQLRHEVKQHETEKHALATHF
jgi:predicted membrane chloride channel (bestrophin family)